MGRVEKSVDMADGRCLGTGTRRSMGWGGERNGKQMK